ncbi:hypothetical protein KP509_15G009700 [Ceratopteris richardii]|uniref:Uncharacterized protein n=1 Tax=Ceratopteris richardii TaxID=49495 RepID=A0A8T2T6Q7_CERRI|nr:hypothetical protein KP509_15G009700 [Ceratopteris richardii]
MASSCKDEMQFTRKERQGDKPRKEGLHVSSTILGCAKPTPQIQRKLPVVSKEQSTDGKKPPPLVERTLQLSDNNCQAHVDRKRHSGIKIDCGSSIGGHCHQKRPLDTESVTKPKMLPPRVQKKPRKTDFEDPVTNDDDADGDISSMIWRMFRYNPNKYHDMDNEDDDLLE